MTQKKRNWRAFKDEFLTYTRAERNGIITLIGLIVLLNAWNVYSKFHRVETYDYSQDIAEIEAAYAQKSEVKTKELALFKFDPNEINNDEMLALGFNERAVKTFMKYRATGVRFNNLADFEKVYSIKKEDITRVKDFIFFGEQKKEAKVFAKKVSSKVAKKAAPTLFEFDPNTASESELLKLGLPERVVKTMLKFRSKATFRKASDVAKIYGLKEDQFQGLLPFIKIEAKEKRQYVDYKSQKDSLLEGVKFEKKPWKKEVRKVDLASIDINTAPVEEWQRIRGVGPTYAKMIVNYRSKLGGFYAVEQISETYGLHDSVYQKIVPYVKSSAPRNKVKINIENVETLAKHPYLDWSESQTVFNYIKKHGAFKEDADVYKCRRLTKEEWQRIVPYFDYSTKVDTFDHDADY